MSDCISDCKTYIPVEQLSGSLTLIVDQKEVSREESTLKVGVSRKESESESTGLRF